MASKKRKLTFTDLADDDFVQKQNDVNLVDTKNNISPESISFTLNDLKKPQITNQQQVHQINNNFVNEEKQSKVYPETIEKKVELPSNHNLNQDFSNTNDPQKNNEYISSETNKQVLEEEKEVPVKKVYEVNYDDILNESLPEENKKILDNLIDKKDPIKELFNTKEEVIKNDIDLLEKDENVTEDKVYKNLKPRSTVKTYNEAIKRQEKRQSESHFEENKIKQFLNVKEKLEVKTNIYLKNSIVIKLSELEERTNESRSSIINKLIEIALKTIEE